MKNTFEPLCSIIASWTLFRDGEFLSYELESAGFEPISYGNFASVIDVSNDKVIKIFGSNDIGYKFLLEYMLANGGEHFPKIFQYKTVGLYGVVEMEKLTHHVKKSTEISEYIDEILHYDHNETSESLYLAVTKLNLEMISHNIDIKTEVTWDHSESNIMFRNDVPILCDVVYGELMDNMY